jgi:glycosyltransferase involved in cell wall biosynthesis
MPDLTILMPVYNEAATVAEAVGSVLETDFGVSGVELLIVDDGSTDETAVILSGGEWKGGADVRLIRRPTNGGKGVAIRDGLAEARGTYTAILDADLEYDPADTGRVLKPLLSGEAEAGFGVRGFMSHSSYSFWYVIGNRGVTLAANVLYNCWISDVMTCHKVMRTDLFRSLQLREPGFGIEPEITARLLRSGVRIYEVPVTYRARSREEGKKLKAVDGLRVLRTLIRCRIT